MDYQFYPTPAGLGGKLAKLIQKPQPPILEPSAGTGELIQAFREGHKYNRWAPRYSEKDFHCIELNPERAVADSFEGRDSYEDTYRNQQFYLPIDSAPLMLTEGKS